LEYVVNGSLTFIICSFSTRSKVPYILKENSQSKYFEDGYEFVPGKDETIIDGKAGYVVSFGEMLYRSWDAVLRCRQQGLDVGLINKPTLNIVDEQVTACLLVLRYRFVICSFLGHPQDRFKSVCLGRRIFESEDWSRPS
jgi:transketolase C-terminal domain/subunit